MKKLFILFLVFAGIQNIAAQVPGYQGKRFTVGFNASSFFYVIGIFDNPLSDMLDNTRISYKSEVNINYTVSRKAAIGFSYYFAKQHDNFDYLQPQQTYAAYYPKNDVADCRLNIYELHIQFFRKNFIAPAGLYHQFSAGIVNYTLADDSLKLYGTNGGTYTVKKPLDAFSGFKLGYCIGKTNPIGHNFYINTAFGVNFFRGGDTEKIKTSVNENNYLLANFNQNLRSHNFFELKLGLGWIAF